ncbi:DegQ family serine endoprotease [Methylobacter sp. Wu8]|uniref:Probable periplasmic serine endoprotease DegP-like n=1 Tax=Methylobacter tundripaludum TaxID=173365 RepID=A0A2S6GY19_9GAMM|nr:DegQ family serine endoprotease [Methylobacter tundripaludum]MCF7966513.1 DegQ family serine endoprotease [Methylobacter tundripaludum]MCK9636061.1 DegQ family serine endoprotease [Methylobacter tundripaludum]PPK70076.1 serine protease Do [Methylobacter tundripaludum]
MLKKVRWCFFLIVLFNRNVLADLPDFTEMVKTNGVAVVNISTTQKAPPEAENAPEDMQLPEGMPPEMEEFFKRFLNEQGGGYVPRDTTSLGSGFIISQDGYVLTNHHVVKDADEIVVKFSDRRELLAKLIGSDARTDVALLKVEAKDLPVVTIGDANKLQVGAWVLAIGSPFGFEQSVTAGIVSAKGRSLPGGNYVPFIQTDVAINPGNSGGPLFNMEGKVVGINSQIYSRTGGFMGLSFAIPMDVVMNVVDQIKATGKASHGWLGVQIQDVTRELAETFGMKKPMGALVSKVVPGSPAEKADLQIGDIITEFNGQQIENSSDLPPMVGITPINDKAALKIIRQGETKTIEFKVGLLPDEVDKLADAKAAPKLPHNRLGINVIDLSDEQRKTLEVPKNGVLVQDVAKGTAKDAGIQRGDVILRIQNDVIRDAADFEKTVKKLPAGKSIAVLVQRQGSPVFLALKVEK